MKGGGTCCQLRAAQVPPAGIRTPSRCQEPSSGGEVGAWTRAVVGKAEHRCRSADKPTLCDRWTEGHGKGLGGDSRKGGRPEGSAGPDLPGAGKIRGCRHRAQDLKALTIAGDTRGDSAQGRGPASLLGGGEEGQSLGLLGRLRLGWWWGSSMGQGQRLPQGQCQGLWEPWGLRPEVAIPVGLEGITVTAREGKEGVPHSKQGAQREGGHVEEKNCSPMEEETRFPWKWTVVTSTRLGPALARNEPEKPLGGPRWVGQTHIQPVVATRALLMIH